MTHLRVTGHGGLGSGVFEGRVLLPFSSLPSAIRESRLLRVLSLESPFGQALDAEVLSMVEETSRVATLLSQIATSVSRAPLGPGFYSRIFVVQKPGLKWRPVLDLSSLNKFIILTPFKMEPL